MNDLSIPRDDSYWLYSKEDVSSVLKSLYYSDTMITIFYKNIFCLSNVVNYDNDYIWLDPCLDKTDANIIMNKPQVYLKAQHDSIPLFLELNEGKEVEFEGRPTWQFKFPARVHKMQRRDAFRVQYPLTLETSVKLSDCPNKFKIIDMSLTGIGLSTDASVNIDVEKKYPLIIKFPDFKNISANEFNVEVIVKYVVTTNDKKKVGLHFTKLNRQQEMLLTKWQTQLQLLHSMTKKDEN